MKKTKIPDWFTCSLFSMIITSLLFFYTCSRHSNNNPEEKKPGVISQIIKKPSSSFGDTLLIDSKAAVLYSPDSLQLETIKKVNKKEVMEMLEHDCHFQMQNSIIVIKKYWPQLKLIEISKVRYLLFVKKDQSRSLIDLNDKNDICGLFLFDGKKDPILADMPNIDTELNFYFNK